MSYSFDPTIPGAQDYHSIVERHIGLDSQLQERGQLSEG